jgi:hypothetical protein
MVDAVFLSTFWDVIWATFIVMFVFVPLILLWTFALVDLFVRHDIGGWQKVLWLLLIIFIPILGPIIYLLVRPEEAWDSPHEEVSPDA